RITSRPPGSARAPALEVAAHLHRPQGPVRDYPARPHARAAEEGAADGHPRNRALADDVPGIIATAPLDVAADLDGPHGPRHENEPAVLGGTPEERAANGHRADLAVDAALRLDEGLLDVRLDREGAHRALDQPVHVGGPRAGAVAAQRQRRQRLQARRRGGGVAGQAPAPVTV